MNALFICCQKAELETQLTPLAGSHVRHSESDAKQRIASELTENICSKVPGIHFQHDLDTEITVIIVISYLASK